MWKSRLAFVILSLAISATGVTGATGQSPEEAWPHINPETGRHGLYPTNIVSAGLEAYCRMTGKWPLAWSDVQEAGIFQVPIVGFHGDIIDPDDGEIDNYGDVVYTGGTERGTAQIGICVQADSATVELVEIPVPPSYADYFANLQVGETDRMGEPRYCYVDWLLDKDMLRVFATLHVIRYSLICYENAYRTMPDSLDQLIEAGMSPVDYSSINPVTGTTYRLDGSPGDVVYRMTQHDDHQSIFLAFVTLDGEPLTGIIY
jgi:hypothetical protein